MLRAASLLLAGSVGLAGCGPGAMPTSLLHPLTGARAPAMAQIPSEGAGVGMPTGAPVKAIVVDFWASWCPGCQESLPQLDALYRDKRDDGLRVVGVSVDEQGEAAYAMARSLNTSFPIIVDRDSSLMGSFRVAQVPLTFVVDGGGTVRFVGRDPGAIRRAVEVILAE